MNRSETHRPRLKTVAMIYLREMRDQLRDRRTIFTIAILPMVLYPLVGTLLLQIAQFTQQHAPKICLIGTENLPQQPALVVDELLHERYHESRGNARFEFYEWRQLAREDAVAEIAQRFVRDEHYDAVLLVPPEFSIRSIRSNDDADPSADPSDIHSVHIVTDPGSDGAAVAVDRIYTVLGEWRNDIVAQRLVDSGIEQHQNILKPFSVEKSVTEAEGGNTMLWSKLLPFVMLIWAMTGAFYPAIDLVAGEKERGTLETLLCSPALRSEIVWGKLGAVTTFSTLTALLNVFSMMVTSSLIFRQMGLGAAGGSFGPPPMASMMWLLLALLPLSALFSALALAVAAMARSSKEGQYYLMPLMMLALPLVLLPMMPGMNLNTGTALIPVSGMFLLVRALVEGQYLLALMHLPMVAGVTFGCLWLATRWAQRQFEDESVLFGGTDQWELRSWVRHLWRDRQAVPSPVQSFACGAVILVGLFFGKLMVSEMPNGLGGLTKLILTPQIGLILAPAVLMAIVMTTSLRQTFRVRMPHLAALPIALLLGVSLHPSYVTLGQWISDIYPISEQTQAAMKPMTDMIGSAPLWNVILLFALVPAICEELAFRGFIFSGLIRGGGRMRAVVVTAVMFGASHGLLQQSLAATVMGLLLGWIALRTGSLLPCLLVHFTNNALSVTLPRIPQMGWSGADLFVTVAADGSATYQPLWVVMASGLAFACLTYFYTLRSTADEEAGELEVADSCEHDPGLQPVLSGNL
ncbi:ABC transporter permease subunit/CPBP intramembrane protease [Roseimaritima ulvae]|uniref:ABC-2 family transporter protein n=1 Tax=Roseimaritima ulvae TaxID=980254 RepID=A0A5B9QQB2_9BACT|nr:ABC transporter permease subunit/CPBP intramembrane protease [Roseimaritima ulvae]QEG41164.1 ABC-2 family transporter protein [Roseimaritima ulvae]